MNYSELQLSNTSFSNKSFQDSFEELLKLAAQLSYKWDPQVSNEADPGVVLLKEMALLIDKNNYVADKNALENMPMSVTQLSVARQLYKLLSYYPSWYLSSKVKLSLQWNVEQTVDDSVSETDILTLDDFIQVGDQDSEYVYTITTKSPVLPCDGSIIAVEAIEGSIKDLEVNGFKNITIDMLDTDNRVYIPDYAVAQNGVFVFNYVDGSIGEYWKQINNLSTEQLNQKLYEFGVDVVNGSVYIQFPDDISNLIESGVGIKYVVSRGSQGNVNLGALSQLFTGGKGFLSSEHIVNIVTDELKISNTELISSGRNPETIDEMYRNYRKVAGTFDTLVTLRDYENAFYNLKPSPACSNDFVCDRTNDVQNSYKIVRELEDGISSFDYKYAAEPFDLKLYALKYNDILYEDVNAIGSEQLDLAYNSTFELFDDIQCEDVLTYNAYKQLVERVNEYKTICHEFKNLDPNKICMIKNKYTINSKIVPVVTLTQLQLNEVRLNIKKALYKELNSHNIDFGQKINYQDIQYIIQNADARIQSVILGNIEYNAYAVYYSEDEKYTVPINNGR